MVTASGVAVTISPGNADWGGEASSTTKKTPQNSGIPGLWLHQISHSSLSQLKTSHSFSVNALTLTADALWGWEFYPHCNLASCWMGFCWFLAHSALWLQELRISLLQTQKRSGHFFGDRLNWESELLNSSFFFFFATLLRDIMNSPHIIIFSKNVWKYIHSHLFLISAWLGVSQWR